MAKWSLPSQLRKWHPRLDDDRRLLRDVYAEIKAIGLEPEEVPWIVRVIEEPEYDLPGVDFFPGHCSLDVHDHIHILLGRGLLPRDEAFVLCFTMGSTNRLNAFTQALYVGCARFLFPEGYRFSAEDVRVFRDAARLGHLSGCLPLNTVDFGRLQDLTIAEARERVGLERDLLEAYFRIEQRRYPGAPESERLL